MAIYAIYNVVTGEIEKLLQAFNQPTVDANLVSGQSYVMYGDRLPENMAQYKVNVSTRQVENKVTQSLVASPSTINADGVEKSVISGIAKNSLAEIDVGEGAIKKVNILDGKLYFCTKKVATHSIKITNPICLDTHVSITAVAP